MPDFPSWWAGPDGAPKLFQNPPVPEGWTQVSEPSKKDTLPTPKAKKAKKAKAEAKVKKPDTFQGFVDKFK